MAGETVFGISRCIARLTCREAPEEKPEPDAETEPEPATGSETEPETESATEPESEPEPDAEPVVAEEGEHERKEEQN